jgi:hypothetical protein
MNAVRDLDGLTLMCDVLSAYRRDLERTPDIVNFGTRDSAWLREALRVERLVSQPDARSSRALSRLAAQPTLRGPRLLALTEQMEVAGALTLAFATLSYARRVWERTDVESCGVAIFRQARIARTSGATRAAAHYYAYLFSYASKHRLPELRGRALVGQGLLVTLEGNPMAGRRWYAKARTASGNHPVASAVAWHADMNAALSMADHSGALVAGWRALETGALGAYDEAGVLVNLAAITLRAGHAPAALTTVRRAVRRCAHPRVRLSAFAKGALAAASLGNAQMVDRFAAKLIRVASKVNVPFEELEARSELAEAFVQVGFDDRARRLARSTKAEAQDHGFATVIQRCDRVLRVTLPAVPVLELSTAAQRVVAELAAA